MEELAHDAENMLNPDYVRTFGLALISLVNLALMGWSFYRADYDDDAYDRKSNPERLIPDAHKYDSWNEYFSDPDNLIFPSYLSSGFFYISALYMYARYQPENYFGNNTYDIVFFSSLVLSTLGLSLVNRLIEKTRNDE